MSSFSHGLWVFQSRPSQELWVYHPHHKHTLLCLDPDLLKVLPHQLISPEWTAHWPRSLQEARLPDWTHFPLHKRHQKTTLRTFACRRGSNLSDRLSSVLKVSGPCQDQPRHFRLACGRIDEELGSQLSCFTNVIVTLLHPQTEASRRPDSPALTSPAPLGGPPCTCEALLGHCH